MSVFQDRKIFPQRLWRVISFVGILILFWLWTAAPALAVTTSRNFRTNSPVSLPQSPAVAYNQRSFIINGKATLIFSGSVHYTRIPPSDWKTVFQLAKELGLNCIQTYVIWSEHQPKHSTASQQEDYKWEGYGNLIQFIETAAQYDLYVVVRIGPYICGEYYFGGIPLWMRHITDKTGERSIECFRCSDPLWKREMQRWTSVVVEKLQPYLASNNGTGPIIWIQMENEYDPDDDYLEWAVDMARNLTIDVPWSLCGHNITACNRLNGYPISSRASIPTEASSKVVCTINGFWADTGVGIGQPGPVFFQALWSGNPTQPAAWTEDQGWFNEWGLGHKVRRTSDQLYGIARFLAYGGSYHNFYMLTGGNNYGLRAGRDVTTAYAPDTPINNLLLRHEPGFSALQSFFKVIRSIENDLLSTKRFPVEPLQLNNTKGTAEAHEYGDITFLSNTGVFRNASALVEYRGNPYFLPNHTVVILNTERGTILFNTSSTLSRARAFTQERDTNIPISNWKWFKEDVGYGSVRHQPEVSPEQLNITDNKSDYMWYRFFTNQTGEISIQAIGYGGYQYSYVNGNRSDAIDGLWSTARRDRELKDFDRVGATTHSVKRIDILSVAMGLSTVVSPETGKGIKSVQIGDTTVRMFETAWKLRGEELEIYTQNGVDEVQWKAIKSPVIDPRTGLIWIRGNFDLPQSLGPFIGGAQPRHVAVTVDLSGLYKGVAYVNGFHIGRYWLIRSKCDNGECAPPHHGEHCFVYWEGCGEPTQRLYHIPFEILKAQNNTITLFEETETTVHRSLEHVKIKIVHESKIVSLAT